MNLDALYSELTLKTKAKLALVVLDGLGDIATREQNYLTPLEAAHTPNLDKIAKDSAQGRMIPAAPGITPGSGPGHLGLFGYDPLEFQVGRGVIEALGLGMELKPGEVCGAREFCDARREGNCHGSSRRKNCDGSLRKTVRQTFRENQKNRRHANFDQSGQGTSLCRRFFAAKDWKGH
ncbi:MAG: hypothetical protein WDM76_10175 [Limisphaerales bacterium]